MYEEEALLRGCVMQESCVREKDCVAESCVEPSSLIAQSEVELKVSDEAMYIQVSDYAVWRNGTDFSLRKYRRVCREKPNLHFLFREQLHSFFCPLFYKLDKVKTQILNALATCGEYVGDVEVTVDDHVMTESDSLQVLGVTKKSVLVVRETEKGAECTVVLRDEASVAQFVRDAEKKQFQSVVKLTLLVGDAEGCERYVPLRRLLTKLSGGMFPVLRVLRIEYAIVGFEEDYEVCFASGVFPALVDLLVYYHEESGDGVKKSEVEEVEKKESEMKTTEKKEVKEGEKKEIEKSKSKPTTTTLTNTTPATPTHLSFTPPAMQSRLTSSVGIEWLFPKWTCEVSHSFYASSMNGFQYETEVFRVRRPAVTLPCQVKTAQSRTIEYEGKEYYITPSPNGSANALKKGVKKVSVVAVSDSQMLVECGIPAHVDHCQLICNGKVLTNGVTLSSADPSRKAVIHFQFVENYPLRDASKPDVYDLSAESGGVRMKVVESELKSHPFYSAIEVSQNLYSGLWLFLEGVALPELQRVTLWSVCGGVA